MIEIKGTEIPNRIDELTIEQFQTVSQFANDLGLSYVERQIKIFEYLGVPDIWDDITAKELKELIKTFNDVPKKEFDWFKSLEIDGYTYTAFEGDEFELSAKDLALIEKNITKSGTDIPYIMAVIFKRTDLSKQEHYAEAHIKQKAKLFAKQPAEICVQYITKVGQEASNMIEKNVAETKG